MAELSVVRRLHREGEGEYLVNRARVRRTDVVELLADIGLAGERHSIISQGRVEEILVSKPEERRALVEEAAGLGKFKRRRHRAELKLARVQVQVERARDLEDEVRKRLRPLALQASAAERAEKLGVEIDGLKTRLAAAELEAIDRPARRGRRAADGRRRRSAAAATSGSRASSPSGGGPRTGSPRRPVATSRRPPRSTACGARSSGWSCGASGPRRRRPRCAPTPTGPRLPARRSRRATSGPSPRPARGRPSASSSPRRWRAWSGAGRAARRARRALRRESWFAADSAAAAPAPEPRRARTICCACSPSWRTHGVVAGDRRASAARLEPPLRARVDAGGSRAGELGEELRRLGGLEAELRRAASEAAERLSAVGIERARLEAEREEVLRRLPEDAEAEALTEEEADELRAQLARLERRREALGQVNPLAAEEHAREKARLEELTVQREDLERSLAELEALRDELAETVERRFEETLGEVERHFEEVAATLFPGGSGRIVRVADEDGGEPGIEIELQPAGKRVTRLSLLSGGEKALGAISFLFALFLARPCPFYLLDEVEAALDDANIGRFTELLRRFSGRAQFIVVTHQKRTIEAADILYGVTMGADGISQVVSKRLAAAPEAEALSA